MALLASDCVLVVDDDPGIRLLLVTFLRRQDLCMLEARNGGEALAAMRAGRADVVLMDLMMPEVSGWDVLREREADPELRRIPVILITANSDRVTIPVNVFAILSKPFDLETLLTTVSACLEHHRVVPPAAAA